MEEFLALIRGLAWTPLPRGSRVGVLTFSGANGVIAADEVEGAGLAMAPLAAATVRRIRALMPDWQPAGNPADVWLALGAGARRAHEEPLLALLEDPGVDAVIAILLALPNTDFAEVREVFARARRHHPDKPIFLVALGGAVKARWLTELEGLQIPVDFDSRLAVRTLRAMVEYARRKEKRLERMAGAGGSPRAARTGAL
jgi:acetyltransferase